MTRKASSPPAVSVIVPVYNAETFLSDCISSILAQTYSDFELIIVDDGSTDASSDIIDRFAATDARIVTIRRPNGGLSAARNTGLDAAHGQYLTFVDADDMIHPRFLSTLLDMMNDAVDIAACASISRKSNVRPCRNKTGAHSVATMSGLDALSIMLYQTTPLRHTAWGKLYRRNLWDNLRFPPGWFEDLHISVDLFPAARQITFTSRPLYFYRRHRGSYLSRADASRADAIKAAQYVMERCVASYPASCDAASDRLLERFIQSARDACCASLRYRSGHCRALPASDYHPSPRDPPQSACAPKKSRCRPTHLRRRSTSSINRHQPEPYSVIYQEIFHTSTCLTE